jgi:SAM-dependent methyltransferase
MWPTTAPLLRRARVGRGMSCLDMGCGGGHVALALARRVGPSGRVVGVDLDAVAIESARRQAARRKLHHAAFHQASVYDWPEEQAYDRIYVRFLLTHLPDREAAVRVLARALRPGGILIVEDTDFVGSFSYPHCRAFARYVDLYREVVRRRGGDPEVGPKLRSLLVRAGLQPMDVALVQPCHYDHEGKALHLSTLLNIADAVVSENLADRAELDQAVGELAAFTDDPTTLLTLPRVFQACGRRP